MFPPLALGSCHSHCSRHLGHLCPRTPSFHLRKILQDPSSLSSPQKPRSSPCPLRVSGLPRTQHTPCFLPRSEGAHLDLRLVSSGGYLDAGHCPPSTMLSSGKGLPLVQVTVTHPGHRHSAWIPSSLLSSFWLPLSSVPRFLFSISVVLCLFSHFAVPFWLCLVLSDTQILTLS